MASAIIHIREYEDYPLLETDSTDSFYREYQVTDQGRIVSVQQPNQHNRRWRPQQLLQTPARVVQELFLPIGFPSSVNQGYLEYQFYDSLQGLCSYLRGVLCTAKVLQAAGVGKAEATALSAAMTWALKDGAAMIGGLYFSYLASPLFDSHVKEFRLFADVINDVGLTLDMLTPRFQDNLLIVASAAGLCKALCGLSAGATKSSITQHFALEGNMADLNAKESTQETLVSLLGMILGICLARGLHRLDQEHSFFVDQLQWLIFSLLTLLHVWANWKGVSMLRLQTLNRERSEIVLTNILRALENSYLINSTKVTHELRAALKHLPTPTQVTESLISSSVKMLWSGRLRLKARLADVITSDWHAVEEFRNERYALALNGRNHVLVSLLTGAKPKDQMKAFLHALLIARVTKRDGPDTQQQSIISRTHQLVDLLFSDDATNSLSLMSELAIKDWKVQDRVYLGFSRRRAQWTIAKDD